MVKVPDNLADSINELRVMTQGIDMGEIDNEGAQRIRSLLEDTVRQINLLLTNEQLKEVKTKLGRPDFFSGDNLKEGLNSAVLGEQIDRLGSVVRVISQISTDTHDDINRLLGEIFTEYNTSTAPEEEDTEEEAEEENAEEEAEEEDGADEEEGGGGTETNGGNSGTQAPWYKRGVIGVATWPVRTFWGVMDYLDWQSEKFILREPKKKQ